MQQRRPDGCLDWQAIGPGGQHRRERHHPRPASAARWDFHVLGGPASAFTIGASFVFATFTAGGTDSVLITDPMGNVLVAGTMQDNGAVLAQYPGGTGSYLGAFTVTEVDPTVLADFGLSGFNPSGSVAFTFGQDQVTSLGVLDAVVGGGTVTIVGTVVPEPSSLVLAGTGLLALCLGVFRMKRWPKK